jgi:hypothetical protein
MNLGEILDRAIQMFRAKFPLFAGLAVFAGMARAGMQFAARHAENMGGPSTPNASSVGLSYGVIFIFWVADVVLNAIATAAVCFAASRVYFGEDTTIRSAFSTYIPKARRMVWLGFLQGIYVGWPFIIVMFFSIAFGAFGPSLWLQAPIWILGSIPSLVLYAQCALAYPASAIENISAYSAIERSKKLTVGGRRRICGAAVFPVALGIGFSYGSEWLIERFKIGNPLPIGSPLVLSSLHGVVPLIADVFFLPLSAIVLTVLYYDQRIRLEGYDIERMMDAAGLTVPMMTAPIPNAPISPAPEHPADEETLAPPAATPAKTSEAHP